MTEPAGRGARRVRVLVNPKAGVIWSFDAMRRAFDAVWDREGTDLSYQFSQSAADGAVKARRAVEDRTDILFVVGGDGTVSTVGRELVGSDVALAVIPRGSGNGFARHFGIPFAPEKAVRAFAKAEMRRIDVGVVDNRPFFVTCSMAWDAAVVRTFDRMPVRGILPYVFAGVYEFFDYEPQRMEAEMDTGETLSLPDPLVFTIANLTQYGGGAIIAPHARPDDGRLELVAACRRHMSSVLANMGRLFNGTIDRIPNVVFRRFRRLRVTRGRAAPIQLDGELVDAPRELTVTVLPQALNVLVPAAGTGPPAGD